MNKNNLTEVGHGTSRVPSTGDLDSRHLCFVHSKKIERDSRTSETVMECKFIGSNGQPLWWEPQRQADPRVGWPKTESNAAFRTVILAYKTPKPRPPQVVVNFESRITDEKTKVLFEDDLRRKLKGW